MGGGDVAGEAVIGTGPAGHYPGFRPPACPSLLLCGGYHLPAISPWTHGHRSP